MESKTLASVAIGASALAILIASATYIIKEHAGYINKDNGDDQPVIMAGGSLHMTAPRGRYPAWTITDPYKYDSPGIQVMSADFVCGEGSTTNYSYTGGAGGGSIVITYRKNNNIYHTVTYTIDPKSQLSLNMTKQDGSLVGESLIRSYIYFGSHPHGDWKVSNIVFTGFAAPTCASPPDGEFYMKINLHCPSAGTCN